MAAYVEESLHIVLSSRLMREATAPSLGHSSLRADAERNRLALIDAAQEVFAEQGIEAPLEEVAARARVGIATLYRRFPTRHALVVAALTERIAQYLGIAERALADDDPWRGFSGFVEQVCALQAYDRALSDLLFIALPANETVERLRRLAQARTAALIERGKDAGVLRPDLVHEDLRLMLLAQAEIVRVTNKDAPVAWRRYVALMLDAFRAEHGRPLPPPPTKAQLARAMRRSAEERGCRAKDAPAARHLEQPNEAPTVSPPGGDPHRTRTSQK